MLFLEDDDIIIKQQNLLDNLCINSTTIYDSISLIYWLYFLSILFHIN